MNVLNGFQELKAEINKHNHLNRVKLIASGGKNKKVNNKECH
jgi:hypothetical protein